MILGLHHVGVATPNLDRLKDFYIDCFHGRVLVEYSWDEKAAEMSQRLGLRHSAGRLAMLAFNSMRLELFQFDSPAIAKHNGLRSVAKPGISHFCFTVDDIQVEYNRLSSVGMRFHGAPLLMPAGGRFTYGRDPDGNVVELLQLPE